jgi:hypothetical protein
MKSGRSQDLIRIKEGVILARNRVNEVKIGHVPCKYVKIVCRSGRPYSMHAVRFNGIASTEIGDKMGPATEYLLYKATERILFGKSLRIARPLAKPAEIQMNRLGGNAPDKSYSYLTNLQTPQSEVLSAKRGLGVYGENVRARRLEEMLAGVSAVKVVREEEMGENEDVGSAGEESVEEYLRYGDGRQAKRSPPSFDRYGILPLGVGATAAGRGSPGDYLRGEYYEHPTMVKGF